jgi:ribulose-5-phosphate 4-epimerase/fuculose-1-phosphate aldolase
MRRPGNRLHSDEDRVAREVCAAARTVFRLGWAVTGGNISVRVGDAIIVTPRGMAADHCCRIRRRDLCWVDVNAKRVRGGEPSRETPVHVAIYQHAKSVRAVVHTHPPYLLSFSDRPDLLRTATESAATLRMMICEATGEQSASLADRISQSLTTDGDSASSSYGLAIFVPRHGLFAASSSIERAVYLSAKLEENARVVLMERLLSLASRE